MARKRFTPYEHEFTARDVRDYLRKKASPLMAQVIENDLERPDSIAREYIDWRKGLRVERTPPTLMKERLEQVIEDDGGIEAHNAKMKPFFNKVMNTPLLEEYDQEPSFKVHDAEDRGHQRKTSFRDTETKRSLKIFDPDSERSR